MPNTKIKFIKRQSGFSLLEVLIANILSLFLMAIVIEIFIFVKNSYQFQTGMQTLHQNISLAAEFLARDIQEAGFIGCGNFAEIKNLDADFTRHIGLLGATNADILPRALANRVIPQTDTFIVEKISEPINYLSVSMINNNELIIYNKDNYKMDDNLLITDCEATEVLQVQKLIHFNDVIIIKTKTPLKKLFPKNSLIARISAIAYFVGKSSYKNKRGDVINALYRKDLFASVFNPDELISGVNNIKIKYAVKKNGHVENLFADEVEDWSSVIGLHLFLLLDSIEPVLVKNYSFEFNKIKYFPHDFKLYKTWQTYIALRERI